MGFLARKEGDSGRGIVVGGGGRLRGGLVRVGWCGTPWRRERLSEELGMCGVRVRLL